MSDTHKAIALAKEHGQIINMAAGVGPPNSGLGEVVPYFQFSSDQLTALVRAARLEGMEAAKLEAESQLTDTAQVPPAFKAKLSDVNEGVEMCTKSIQHLIDKESSNG